MHKEKTEVLVVGAGPVGMLAALMLRKLGIRVRIIDQETRTTTHSYACALHPGTLQLLGQWEMAHDVISEGQLIETIAIYDKTERRAELQLRDLDSEFRCALVLPQSRFEEAIERKLADDGVEVEWSHRLSALEPGEEKVSARVDRLRESAKGYAVPDFDWEVIHSLDVTADFVIGADGRNSHVRHCLGISPVVAGPKRTFAMYEFASDVSLLKEMRIVLHDGANVLWPLPGNRCRWTFELTSRELEEFPTKERSRFVPEDKAMERERRETLQEFISGRARWFRGSIEEIEWAPRVQFEPFLVERLGEGRCWLIGDAAHQVPPIGVQSMNVGLREAVDLAVRMAKILREHAPLHLLEEFAQERRSEWQQLLAPDTIKSRPQTDPWVEANARQLVSCLPASDHTLAQLFGLLEVDFQPRAELHPV